MSTRELLAKAKTVPTKGEKAQAIEEKGEPLRIKKTITLAPNTVKALHKLKAHISIEEDRSTDFGRIIDEAVIEFLQKKGL
jgi:hypothetical protein